MVEVKSFDYKELLRQIEETDQKYVFRTRTSVPDGAELQKKLENFVDHEEFSTKTVLGIDIYKYSEYEPLRQALVPFLFKLMYKEASALSLRQSNYMFQRYDIGDFEEEFISTGDGGFQIFPTPLHAVTYAIYFELIVRYYNSYHFYPQLRNVIGEINLRYAMTTDKIYQLDNAFFGPSIINNDRILSKDSLNRFLFDDKTYNWFMIHLNGIENLQFISLNEINQLPEFEQYELGKAEGVFPRKMDFDFKKIISVDIQKIGDITAKSNTLSIYNFHLQYLGGVDLEDVENSAEKHTVTTVSLGNLNTSGID